MIIDTGTTRSFILNTDQNLCNFGTESGIILKLKSRFFHRRKIYNTKQNGKVARFLKCPLLYKIFNKKAIFIMFRVKIDNKLEIEGKIMLVNFNPMVSNKKQNVSFNALPIAKITKNAAEADMFRVDVAKGKYPSTEENIKDLFTAIEQATKEKKLGVKTYLEDIVEYWGITIPIKQ
ncbi:MAG: hypothetical protein PHV68_08390 [Candidatus Gastranaerophilales bacterium]|nr:hypothetical protein [Candidatus Gastranaerophilales bacterium]